VVQYPVANTRRPAINARSYIEEGGFRITINVERGRGTATIRDYGEQLAALFRDVELDNGVRCLVPTEPFTDDRSDEGNFSPALWSCPTGSTSQTKETAMAKLTNTLDRTWGCVPKDGANQIEFRARESKTLTAEQMKLPEVQAALHVGLLAEDKAPAPAARKE
jgi:hypothetical protein